MNTLLGFYRFPCLTSGFVGVFNEPQTIDNCFEEKYRIPYLDIPFNQTDLVTEEHVKKGLISFPFENYFRVYWPNTLNENEKQYIDLYFYYPVNVKGLSALLQKVNVDWLTITGKTREKTLLNLLQNTFKAVKSIETTRYEFHLPLPFYVYRLLAEMSSEFFLREDTISVVTGNSTAARALTLIGLAWKVNYYDILYFESRLPVEFVHRYYIPWKDDEAALLDYIKARFKYRDDLDQVAYEFVLQQHTAGR